jgi:hypothetical protein
LRSRQGPLPVLLAPAAALSGTLSPFASTCGAHRCMRPLFARATQTGPLRLGQIRSGAAASTTHSGCGVTCITRGEVRTWQCVNHSPCYAAAATGSVQRPGNARASLRASARNHLHSALGFGDLVLALLDRFYDQQRISCPKRSEIILAELSCHGKMCLAQQAVHPLSVHDPHQ